jgi:tRNA nucleotidyltransferase/poly(A) polymerase
MADYIYTMESRLSPDQMRTVNSVQQIARSHGMNVYMTGGAIRDLLSGFPIRDLDFAVQGNPLRFQNDIEQSGGIVDVADSTFSVLHVVLQGIRAEISMARSEVFDKPGKPPLVTPATINEDLRRRDFTFNAMALSLNEGSRGLLLDPFNGAADIEAQLIRVLHSYAFLEDPSRLVRATRFATRFGWELEERTRARYDSAREGEYIQFLGERAVGYEIEQIAQEENPIAVMRALEDEGWLKVLYPKWTVVKADVPELAQLLKTRATMAEFNISVDAAPAVMHFLTSKLSDGDIEAIQRLIPHREFVAAWKRLDNDANELSKKLLSKEAALNSGAWKILSSAKPEALLYLDVTGRNKAVDEKVKNFFGKWRQLQETIPVTEMGVLRITPQLPEYPQICQEAFMQILDGQLRSEGEIMKFLAPFEPPLPPPPPTPARRGRAAAKKASAPAPKAAVRVAAVAVVDVTKAIPEKSSAESSKGAVETKQSAPQKLSSEKQPVKTPTAAKPILAKKLITPAGKSAAEPARTLAKASSKAEVVGKIVSKKATKPAIKAVKLGKPAVKTAQPVAKKKSTGKKATKSVPDKKHGHPDHTREKKHSKRR